MAIKKRKRGFLKYPGGQPTPMRDNPSSRLHYGRLIRDGIESEKDYPEAIGMDNYRDIFPNPKNRKPLRERRFNPRSEDMREEGKDWITRQFIEEDEIPPKLRKKIAKKPKSKRKMCSCKKR